MARRRRDLTHHRNYALLREYKATLITRERMSSLGAHGVGIGRKEVHAERTDTLALLFYVARKQPVARLSADRIPESVTLFSRKAQREFRLPTDVIETPPVQFEQDPETRIRPVPGGVSFGTSGATGTLGGWVWDETDDTMVCLSNNHVLGNTVGADTLQQGTGDGGSLPADKIGDVKRTIPRSATEANTVDCAISDVDDLDNVLLQVLEIGPAVFATEVPAIDMLVEKYGQTTRHTFGEITDADLETTTDGFLMDDCLRIVPVDPSEDWSAGGDSGSLVFSQTPVSGSVKPAVGLHFGGSGVNGAACKIQNVFAALDVTSFCSGFFVAFIEALFEAESEGEVGRESETELRTVSAAAARPGRGLPPPAAARLRRHASSRRFHAGIAREMQARLATTRRGRILTSFVDEHRFELTTLLLQDGDLRRATIAALRPIVAGATTTTDVLERAFSAQDLKRLDAVARELSRRGSKEIQESLKPVLALGSSAEGKTAAAILGIKL
jgi:hypothetical protein